MYRSRGLSAVARTAGACQSGERLTWQEHIDRDFRFITVHPHKTPKTLERPQVVPISEQLRVILRDAWQRTHTYLRGGVSAAAIKTIRGGLRSADDRCGLSFGGARAAA